MEILKRLFKETRKTLNNISECWGYSSFLISFLGLYFTVVLVSSNIIIWGNLAIGNEIPWKTLYSNLNLLILSGMTANYLWKVEQRLTFSDEVFKKLNELLEDEKT